LKSSPATGKQGGEKGRRGMGRGKIRGGVAKITGAKGGRGEMGAISGK